MTEPSKEQCIEILEREIRLRKERDRSLLSMHYEDAVAILAHLRREDGRDAERYRFFRASFSTRGQLVALARMLGCNEKHFEPSLDDAIDTAILAAPSDVPKEAGGMKPESKL